jgi:hypothetical protein
MFIRRVITAAIHGGLLGRRRWSALLLATGALILAMAGPATAAPIPIPLNATNWSGSAGFGSTSPGWYEDSLGIIHLTGAARQISLRSASLSHANEVALVLAVGIVHDDDHFSGLQILDGLFDSCKTHPT